MAAAVPALAAAYGAYSIIQVFRALARAGLGGIGAVSAGFLEIDRSLATTYGLATLLFLVLAVLAFRGRIQASVVPDALYAAGTVALPLLCAFTLGLTHWIVLGVVLQRSVPGESHMTLAQTSSLLSSLLIATLALGLGTTGAAMITPLALLGSRRPAAPRAQRILAWLWTSGALLFAGLTVTLVRLSAWLYQRAMTGR